MSNKKFICPPTPASGAGTFSDNLVGLQLVQGGGLTQGNFEFVTSVTEKVNRNFITGVFSGPINLENLGISSIEESRAIFENNYKVYPNFDLTQVSNFTLYGSLSKRISTSIETIISFFPAAIESTFLGINYITGATANNIIFNLTTNQTSFELDAARIRNPFNIDFTSNSTRNLSLREVEVSKLRNFTDEYSNYCLFLNETAYNILGIVPTNSLNNGILKIFVEGNPFSGNTFSYENLVIRPNDLQVNKVFNEKFDEVQNFLLNRNVSPVYTSTFKIPKESEDGTYYVYSQNVTFPLYGKWNLDIITKAFENYLITLNDISESLDLYKTNLISRFLTTGAFKEFDTEGQKMQKVLQIYGRSFDETKKFINALAYMNSVNYNIGNDVPSQLLKNLSETLGWTTNISPITNTNFLDSVFGQNKVNKSNFTGINKELTPDELNYQYFRNLILNSAFLFKSKGTRKSIENLMRLIGAPEALVEFNEYVYLADQKINLNQFNTFYSQISGGTYNNQLPTLDPTDIFSIFGQQFTGFTTATEIFDVNLTYNDYPIDDYGYPYSPEDTEDFFFQIGAGWYESTPSHRSPEKVDLTNSVFTGQNPNFQTSLLPFSYGQIYLNRFRKFPFMNMGFSLTPTIDNNKSWTDTEIGVRSNLDGGFNARYFTEDDRLVLNVKNVDLFLNPAQGLVYDVWYMSRQLNFPIPNQGLKYVTPTYCDPNPKSIYPSRGGVDWTEINPQPKRKTFFEFAQTFWNNTINVRNRLFSTDGKTSGYPTLQSIYWKYLESEEYIGVKNDNFTYSTMIKYVEGIGDYWIKLVEQMIPATTIWNTGIKYENSIFHRQKFVWRRQPGCQLVAVPCNPCTLTANIFNNDCPVQTAVCTKLPFVDRITGFGSILGVLLQNYLTSIGFTLGDCDLNSLNSEWFIDIKVNNTTVSVYSFFNGVGYTNPILSIPSSDDYENGLTNALNSLEDYGYSYYFSNDNIVIFNNICSRDDIDVNLKINIGINFQIFCN
jgi:hypothetical protein